MYFGAAEQFNANTIGAEFLSTYNMTYWTGSTSASVDKS